MTTAYSRPNVPRRRFGAVDVALIVLVFGLLYGVLHLGRDVAAPLGPEGALVIDLNPAKLPYYAGRSLLRMFIALAASLAFALPYGYVAAYNRRAENVLVPLLDVLQSVPVLGFLSVVLTGLMGLFPGRLAAVEIASIIAIFTGQVWNMTFSFYHSLTTIPRELREAATIYRLSAWQRFVRLEVPHSTISLVWNSMMSFGGGWFFLAASEAITVLNRDIRLPGIGSFMASALDRGDVRALVYAVGAMVLIIVLVDQLFWRPIVAWSQRFKLELTELVDEPRSTVLTALRRSWVVHWFFERAAEPVAGRIGRGAGALARVAAAASARVRGARVLPRVTRWALAAAVSTAALWYAYLGALAVAGLDARVVLRVVGLGLLTAGRVFAAVGLGALWAVPAGVVIGLNPRLARAAQPLVQIAASFPANMLFPFVTIIYLRYAVNFELGAIPLMMLGTQWYVLFNVIAGASALPADLKEASSVFKLRGAALWRHFILPGIFPSLVTGGVTAAGGAWNASIVAEIVSWRGRTLAASGLGAFIAGATRDGRWPEIIWGITVMALFVVVLNRAFWRRLYSLAETRYHLE